jgi:hypothetical protein
MKKSVSKMNLSRETLRQLGGAEIGRAAATQPTDQPFCVSDALSCSQWCNVNGVG